MFFSHSLHFVLKKASWTVFVVVIVVVLWMIELSNLFSTFVVLNKKRFGFRDAKQTNIYSLVVFLFQSRAPPLNELL